MRARSFSLFVLLFSVFGMASGAELDRSVRDFGAVGDGVRDDTAAIELALVGGGVVHFPAGRYRITRTIRVGLNANGPLALSGDGAAQLEMEGEGPTLHLVGTVKKTASPPDFPDDFWEKEGGATVSGITFVGRAEAAVGLQVTRTMQLSVINCRFLRLRHGIHFTERNRNALIADSHLYDNRGAGVFVDRVDFHQLNITGCHISYNHGGGVVVRGGSVRNVQIGACDIEANVGPSSPVAANILLDATGGSIGEVEITGCTIQHYPGTPGFANIRFIGHSTKVPFTDETRHGNLVVTGNMINDADVNVHLDGVRGAVLSGNSIHIGMTHDILIENSSQIIVADTVLDRHPRYNPDRATAGGPRQQGIVIRKSDACTLTGLRINGGRAPAAIDVSGGDHFSITGCTITGTTGIALRLEGVKDSLVSNNILVGTAEVAAIEVHGGSGNIIANNLSRGRTAIAPESVAQD